MQSPEAVRSDIALMKRIAARDASAVGELYDRHGRLLYGLVLRILRDPGEAEDVLQEVFVLAWNRADTYNQQAGSPAAWLVTAARNRAIDRLRAKATRRRALESTHVDCDSREDPETSASRGERRRVITSALCGLPREQRHLIEEAYYLGLTQSELAERHRLPLGTVKTRIRTGLLALRQQLSQTSIP